MNEALRGRIEQLRAGVELAVGGETIAARNVIAQLYERRGFRAVWFRPEHMRELVDLVEGSRSHGLDPDDYHGRLLRHYAFLGEGDGREVADRELLLTDALVRLAYHLHFGKVNPRELYADWDFSRSLGPIAPVDALEALLDAGSLTAAVAAYAPQLPLYDRLRQGLTRYQALESAGGWASLPGGATLRTGSRNPRVALLRQRLIASGDLLAAPAIRPDLYDQALEEAVMSFQAAHGLKADGVVGMRTLEALNVPVAGRIDQIRVNLERLRWVAQALRDDYLVVDIAGFSARLHLGGKVVWSSRAVVGLPYRQTPVFRSTMRHIVLNPAWNVPPTILREDLIPRLIEDRRYLEKHSMQVVDAAGRPIDALTIDWRRYRANTFPYQIVQAPGDDNPLGRVKFVFPNAHAVYLHDTPVKGLFGSHERAFSSGCVRLENPLELARLLLDDAAQWSKEALDAAIAEGTTRILEVTRHVPVAVLYLTADTDDAGKLRFRRDLYERDAAVLAALASPFRFSPVDREPAGAGRL